MTKLTDALFNLGFKGVILYDESGVESRQVSAAQQHSALIENLYFAGYLSEDKLIEDIQFLNKSSFIVGGETRFFAHISRVVRDAESLSDIEGTINTQYIIDHLFADEHETFDIEDVEDLLLYWGQSAFDRQFGQERSELTGSNWMDVHRDRYLDNAQILGMRSNIPPHRNVYDETWIQGAARLRTVTRITDLKHLIESGKIATLGAEIKLLAGNRELWAEIDGIGDDPNAKRDEGIRYMHELAVKHGIGLAEDKFVFYETKADIPASYKGKRHEKRTYLNYADEEGRRITEASMSKDICDAILPEIQVIDCSVVDRGHYRPTTITTSKQAVADLVANLPDMREEVHILIVTNQPYVERMCIPIQLMMDQKQAELGVSITAHGIGSASEVGVAPTHSEFGALCAEKYKAMISEVGAERKRPLEALMFQTRGEYYADIAAEEARERGGLG